MEVYSNTFMNLLNQESKEKVLLYFNRDKLKEKQIVSIKLEHHKEKVDIYTYEKSLQELFEEHGIDKSILTFIVQNPNHFIDLFSNPKQISVVITNVKVINLNILFSLLAREYVIQLQCHLQKESDPSINLWKNLEMANECIRIQQKKINELEKRLLVINNTYDVVDNLLVNYDYQTPEIKCLEDLLVFEKNPNSSDEYHDFKLQFHNYLIHYLKTFNSSTAVTKKLEQYNFNYELAIKDPTVLTSLKTFCNFQHIAMILMLSVGSITKISTLNYGSDENIIFYIKKYIPGRVPNIKQMSYTTNYSLYNKTKNTYNTLVRIPLTIHNNDFPIGIWFIIMHIL